MCVTRKHRLPGSVDVDHQGTEGVDVDRFARDLARCRLQRDRPSERATAWPIGPDDRGWPVALEIAQPVVETIQDLFQQRFSIDSGALRRRLEVDRPVSDLLGRSRDKRHVDAAPDDHREAVPRRGRLGEDAGELALLARFVDREHVVRPLQRDVHPGRIPDGIDHAHAHDQGQHTRVCRVGTKQNREKQ